MHTDTNNQLVDNTFITDKLDGLEKNTWISKRG